MSWSDESGVQERDLCQVKAIKLVEITKEVGVDRRESKVDFWDTSTFWGQRNEVALMKKTEKLLPGSQE